MQFTLWSHASLLGEVELTDYAGDPRMLVGPFHPTDAGRAVLPLFLEAQAAVMAIGPMLERRGISREHLGVDLGQAVYDALHASPEGRHMVQARETLDALALALYDGAGRPAPIGHVTIQEPWTAASAAETSDQTRARLDAAGYPQYLAAVVLIESSPASRPST